MAHWLALRTALFTFSWEIFILQKCFGKLNVQVIFICILAQKNLCWVLGWIEGRIQSQSSISLRVWFCLAERVPRAGCESQRLALERGWICVTNFQLYGYAFIDQGKFSTVTQCIYATDGLERLKMMQVSYHVWLSHHVWELRHVWVKQASV